MYEASVNPYRVPAMEAPVDARVAFLRKVGALTLGGLAITGLVSVAMAALIVAEPLLLSRWVSLAVMLGAIFGSQWIGRSLVASPSSATQISGFVAGTALQGVAFGYLVLMAVAVSASAYANPFVLLLQAVGLVGLTVLGMVGYLLTGPKNLSVIGGAMSALALPMLALMVLTWVFPIGGIAGILLSVVFVGLSAGGLVYNLNVVMHQMGTDEVVPASYHVTLGILTLFWNVLVLLMRLQRR